MTTRWQQGTGGTSGRDYAAGFDALAADGVDVHGEAHLCAALVTTPARVLDAGCGTGRVAVRLAELGYDVTGVDLDETMLAEARAAAPALHWVLADLAGDLMGELANDPTDPAPEYELVLAAGNVLPLCAPGTEQDVIRSFGRLLAPAGLLLMGFGLDDDHLPESAAHLRLAEVDDWCAATGLELVDRWATWDREPYDNGGYAVSAYRRAPGSGAAASRRALARCPGR